MTIKHIPQAVSEESLFNTLNQWFEKGAGAKNDEIQIISAFASGKGIRAIAPLVDIFLSKGNSLEIIFGIDRGGTDKEAITQLFSLQQAYPNQLGVWIFQAPNNKSIFHPKLYLYRSDKFLSAVVGSANLTLAGLGSNLESLILFENLKLGSKEAQALRSIWEIFRHPQTPLKKSFLNRLDKTSAEKYKAKLPIRSSDESKQSSQKLKELWHPLSSVILPQSGTPIKPRRRVSNRIGQSFLLIDVLEETRETQMQFPLDVIEEFWGIQRDKPAKIDLSIWTSEGLTQPIPRTVVISSGGGKRLMRRIEMPTIKNMPRPLAAMFIKLSGKGKYAYILLPHNSAAYKKASLLLGKHGQQGKGKRRYIIAKGKKGVVGELLNIKNSVL